MRVLFLLVCKHVHSAIFIIPELGKTELSSSLFEHCLIFLAPGEKPKFFGRAYLVCPNPSHWEKTPVKTAGLGRGRPGAAGGDLAPEDNRSPPTSGPHQWVLTPQSASPLTMCLQIQHDSFFACCTECSYLSFMVRFQRKDMTSNVREIARL